MENIKSILAILASFLSIISIIWSYLNKKKNQELEKKFFKLSSLNHNTSIAKNKSTNVTGNNNSVKTGGN